MNPYVVRAKFLAWNDRYPRNATGFEGPLDRLQAAFAAGYEEAEVEQTRYRELCAAVYQAASEYGLPGRFLDALSDAANGEIGKRVRADELLPVYGPASGPAASTRSTAAPIPLLLFCPMCGVQHIDAPESSGWNNPPHRSHLCHACGCIWRPADVPTASVEKIKTRGKNDTFGVIGRAKGVNARAEHAGE